MKKKKLTEQILAELWDVINEKGLGVWGNIGSDDWKLARELFRLENLNKEKIEKSIND